MTLRPLDRRQIPRSDRPVGNAYKSKPPPGKISERFINTIVTLRLDEFLGQANFPWPADQLRLQEHRSVFRQAVEDSATVEKIFLTASGGPFRDWELPRLENVSPDEALRHPNWDMGDKISIDSATMMNKGLELIEACWLFDVDHHDVEILLHRQSIIHSMVSYNDGSVIAQLGNPDMRTPIANALASEESVTDVPNCV